MTEAAPSTLFSPTGIEVPVGSPAEDVRLRARGYTPEAPGTVGPEQFNPGDHTVAEVLAYIEANPDQGDAVVTAEQAGKNRAGITGA